MKGKHRGIILLLLSAMLLPAGGIAEGLLPEAPASGAAADVPGAQGAWGIPSAEEEMPEATEHMPLPGGTEVPLSAPRSVESIQLSRDELVLNVGTSERLTAEVLPAGAANARVQWYSHNPRIATVSTAGEVSAIAPGSTDVSCYALDGSGAFATCHVVVTQPVPPTSITLTANKLKLGIGEKARLGVSEMLPVGATARLRYSSSDEELVAVDEETGVLTAGNSVGTATVTVEADHGVRAHCEVSVREAPRALRLEEELVLSAKQMASLPVGLRPSGSAGALHWSSSDRKVVTVKEGLLTAVGEGSATITVTAYNGIVAHCAVTVLPEPTAVELSADSLLLGKKEQAMLEAQALAEKRETVSEFSYRSSDEAVVSVKNGKITARRNGVATVTVQAHNGVSAACRVTVVNAPKRLSLDREAVSLRVGEAFTLTGRLTEGSASALQASMDEKKIIRVKAVPGEADEFRVTALKPGTVTITVRTYNNKKAKCTVTVSD